MELVGCMGRAHTCLICSALVMQVMQIILEEFRLVRSLHLSSLYYKKGKRDKGGDESTLDSTAKGWRCKRGVIWQWWDNMIRLT